MIVHSALPGFLTDPVREVFEAVGVKHLAHGYENPLRAAEQAAGDGAALAMIGPYLSRDVAEAVEATAPASLPLLAPVATWVGVTRDDEPGCDDPARHEGTVLRLVARDTVVAERIAKDVRRAGLTALVVAGDHEYGRQLDGQLSMAGLPRAEDPAEAGLIVVAGLAGELEIARVEEIRSLPVVAFDGVQGADVDLDREWRMALPFAPVDGVADPDVLAGTERARRAAQMVVQGVRDGAHDRESLLVALRALGPFDERGDPVDPPVWLWRAQHDWTLAPDRPLPARAPADRGY